MVLKSSRHMVLLLTKMWGVCLDHLSGVVDLVATQGTESIEFCTGVIQTAANKSIATTAPSPALAGASLVLVVDRCSREAHKFNGAPMRADHV